VRRRCRELLFEGEGHATAGSLGVVVAIAMVAVVVMGAITAFVYETKWPPHVEDRELSRIGPPLTRTLELPVSALAE